MSAGVKHKAVATWLALLAGVFGLHRFYLHGLKDRWAWLFPLPTLLGLVGVQRMDQLGQDDRLAWVLIPLLGVSLVTALLSGIVYGLTQGGPMNSTHVLATLSYSTALMSGNLGEGAAISLTMLPLLLILIVWQLHRIRKSNVT